MGRIWIGIALAAALAAAAGAEPPAPQRTFALELGDGWRAEALTTALAADLADDKLALAKGAPDLVVRGTLDATTLRYELDALWPGAPPPVRGLVALGATDRARLAGTLRDQLHRLVRATSAARATSEVELPGIGGIMLAIAAVAVLLATPFAFARTRLRRAWPVVRHLALAVAGVGAIALLIAALGDRLENPTGLLLAAGGLAWGMFAVATLPIVFPPIVGLSRIDHEELPRVLRAWLVLALQRAVAVTALYAPIAIAIWFVGGSLERSILFGLVVPVAMLVARSWIRATVAITALALDDALIDRAADVPAWDAAVRTYLVGYLRRNGLPVDDALLARVQLLPGVGDDVAVYGGGLTPSRIVIPRAMLELALAPWGRPHDYAAPRVSTLHWTEWNAGLVVATEPGAVVATRAQRQPRELSEFGESEREALGEPPTLAGIVEPVDLDPRTSYRPHDDPMWLDWESGEEYDGTDAGDRDFLFGLLVEALGKIQRHADRWSTLGIALGRMPRARAWLARARWLGRAPAAVGDDHAALGGARHHLVQYLGWRLARREDLLTARAYAPELEAASRRVIATITSGDPELRRRLARLGGQAPVSRWRRLVLASVVIAGATIAIFEVANAVRYHAVYARRMELRHGKAK